MSIEHALQSFEQTAKENGCIYWLAHELMITLGYENWTSFQSVVNKAMASCGRLDIDVTDAFIPSTYIDELGKETKTFRLTRFACFLIAMHADARKPKVAEIKVMLAALVDQLISKVIGDDELSRIETRDDLKFAEKEMGATALDAGLAHEDFGIFKDAGFRGMYNMSLKKLIEYKGVTKKNPTLYDFMGMEELAGNLFRVTQTTARIQKDKPMGLTQLKDTAQAVGTDIRKMMIRNSGTTPEDLPISEDISKLKSQFKKTNKKMEKLDKKKDTK